MLQFRQQTKKRTVKVQFIFSQANCLFNFVEIIFMIKQSQVYRFNTMLLLDTIPHIMPVWVELKIATVDYNTQEIEFEAGPYDTDFIDANLQTILQWFQYELPKIDSSKSALRTPTGFEIFIRSGDAQLLPALTV
jgi:hypothetical protein